MMVSPGFHLALLGLTTLTTAQRRIEPQTNTFASNYVIPPSVAQAAELDSFDVNNIQVAIRFERSNWATGPVLSDPFYTSIPSSTKNSAPGTLIKVEQVANVDNYTIAPALALSRIVYQSKTLMGDLVPVSAYILWPYYPKNGAKKAPLVSWGHGSSGFTAECAPSHIRNLWYQFSGPYELALAGYAVVATDYAGLGVPKTAGGKTIPHEVSANPAAGNDLLYAAQAAYAAFPDKLTKGFVAMGHSQGGGAAWGAAQQQLTAKVPGYLGAIAASPAARPVDIVRLFGITAPNVLLADSFLKQYPGTKVEDLLTPQGEQVRNLIKAVQGCQSVITEVANAFAKKDPTLSWGKPDFINSTNAGKWEKLVNVGGNKDFKGPMLVIQGTDDYTTPEQLTTKAIQETCAKFPKKQLDYVKAKGVGHVPVMYASHQIWMQWLDECFSGNGCKSEKGKCTFTTIGDKAPRPLDSYTGDLSYFLEFATEGYQVA